MPDDIRSQRSRYSVEAVVRACDLLDALGFDAEPVRLRDLVARTRINKTTAFRILSTLGEPRAGRAGGKPSLPLRAQAAAAKQVQTGILRAQLGVCFSREVTESLTRAAGEEHIDLIALNNQYNTKLTVRHAEFLIRERVDLVMEHQAMSGSRNATAWFLKHRRPFSETLIF